MTPIIRPPFDQYAHDKVRDTSSIGSYRFLMPRKHCTDREQAELTGYLCLYLLTEEAEYLRGGLASVNWDIEEMKRAEERIVGEKLLKIKYSTVLPASGEHGLEGNF